MENPYQPSSTPAQLPPPLSGPLPRVSVVSLLAFLPGTIAGLHVGASLEAGIVETLNRTANDPKGAAIFFCTFSIATLVLSFLYRIPRRYMIGPHQTFWWSTFCSGMLIVGLGISTLVTLEWLKLYANPPQLKDFVLMFFVAVFSFSIGIEFEAFIGSRRSKPT